MLEMSKIGITEVGAKHREKNCIFEKLAGFWQDDTSNVPTIVKS